MAYGDKRIGKKLKKEDALEVLKHLSSALGGDVRLSKDHPIEKIAGGKCRDSYLLTTNKGEFVVTFFTFNWQSAEPEAIHELQKKLSEHGISVPVMIGETGYLGSTPFEVSRYIPTTPSKNPTAQQLKYLAYELGQLHKIGDEIEIPDNFSTGRDLTQAAQLAARIYSSAKTMPSFTYILGTSLRDLISHASASVNTLLKKHTLPEGLTHGDMNISNVLFQDNRPVLLDWERSRKDCYLMEVTKAITEFVILPNLLKGERTPARAVGSFLKHYNEIRPLTPAEIKNFSDVLMFQATRCAAKEPIILGRYGRLPSHGVSLLTEVADICRELDVGQLLNQQEDAKEKLPEKKGALKHLAINNPFARRLILPRMITTVDPEHPPQDFKEGKFLIFIGGGRASGKTTLKNYVFDCLEQEGYQPKYIGKFGSYAFDGIINNRLVQWTRNYFDKFAKSAIKNAADSEQGAVSGLIDNALNTALKQGSPVVLDYHMDDPCFVKKVLGKAKEMGYETIFLSPNIKAETYFTRAEERYQRTGRPYDTESGLATHRGFSEHLDTYFKLFDLSILLSNEDRNNPLSPVAVATPHHVEILNERAYANIRRKAGLNTRATTPGELYPEPQRSADHEIVHPDFPKVERDDGKNYSGGEKPKGRFVEMIEKHLLVKNTGQSLH